MIGKVDLASGLSIIGSVLKWMALPLLVPLTYSFLAGTSPVPFLVTMFVAICAGWAFERLHEDPDLRLREAFFVVSVTWFLIPAIGALPFYLSGSGVLSSPVNAFFESMSGFTTTGSTVLREISFQVHSGPLLIWRQIIQWLGGMGIIVLALAILPQLSIGGSQLMKAEAPGPDLERIAPRIRLTARNLWMVYVALTILEILILNGLHHAGLAPQMNLYNTFAHGFTTMPTGGFSPEARSIEAFSASVQWVIIPFMICAGLNFALLWRVLLGNVTSIFDDREFSSYLEVILLFSLFIIVVLVLRNPDYSYRKSVRHGLFQTVAIVTTTGYASVDFNEWSQIAHTILFIAMFAGGCAGSTGGGIKIKRWVVSVKAFFRELYLMLHSRAVRPVRVGSQILDENIVRQVLIFVLAYFFLFLTGSMLIYIDSIRFGLELGPMEVLSTAASCLGNIGPGLNKVGPMNNYAFYSPLTKLFLSVLMWLGRLEIITVLLLFFPAYWND